MQNSNSHHPGGNFVPAQQGGNNYQPQQQQESNAAMHWQPDPQQGNRDPRNGFHHYNALESNLDNAQQGNVHPYWW